MKTTIALLFTIISSIFSQADSVYKFTLPELTIAQNVTEKEEIYVFENERNVFLLSDSLLKADPIKFKYSVPVSKIIRVSVHDGSSAWSAAQSAGIVGGGIGLILGIAATISIAKDEHATGAFFALPLFTLAGALSGGILGALFGALIPHYESYTLPKGDQRAKNEMLKKIFRYHKQ